MEVSLNFDIHESRADYIIRHDLFCARPARNKLQCFGSMNYNQTLNCLKYS